MSAFLYWLEQRAQEWIARGEKRIPVRVKSPVGWGISGQLTADGNPNNAVQLQVSFAEQMQTHTIQFDGPDSNVDAGGIITPSPEAEILWQVNGITNRRLVSVLDGQSVSGLAQSVTVNVRDTAVGGNGAAYSVGITAAPGVRASTDQPPTFIPSGVTSAGAAFKFGTSIIAGDFITWNLPGNAGIVSNYLELRMAVGTVLESVAVTFRAANAGVLATLDGSVRNRWMPIPQGTNSIRVTNNTASTISAFLTLGVDG